jgi:hypothetical protein
MVEGDKVVPLHSWDLGDHLESYSQILTFQIDAVLDPEKLRSALEELLEFRTWRKLGARLRKSVGNHSEAAGKV